MHIHNTPLLAHKHMHRQYKHTYTLRDTHKCTHNIPIRMHTSHAMHSSAKQIFEYVTVQWTPIPHFLGLKKTVLIVLFYRQSSKLEIKSVRTSALPMNLTYYRHQQQMLKKKCPTTEELCWEWRNTKTGF